MPLYSQPGTPNALPKAGGTMTGLLTLSGAPTTTLHAATKAYVDAAGGGGTTYAPTTVSAAGTTQGTATALATNFSVVGTVASGSGVKVANLMSQIQLIYNAGANALNIYPIASMAFGSDVANTVFVLDVGRCAGIVVTSATQAYIIFNSSSAA